MSSNTYKTIREIREDFKWGPIVAAHEVGPYAIIEYHPTQASNVSDAKWAAEGGDDQLSYSLFVRSVTDEKEGWYRTGHSYGSLDAALIAGVVFRNEWRNRGINVALNEKLTSYVMRALGKEE